MFQKIVAKPDTFVSAFDQTGDIGQDKRAIAIDLNLAEVWVLGRKGVVGDLRAGTRQPAEQCAFSGVGHPDQTDIGDDLEFQYQQLRFTFVTWRPFAWCLVGRRLERRIPLAALAAASCDNRFAFNGKIFDYKVVFGIDHNCANWDLNNLIASFFPVLVGSLSVDPAFGSPVLSMRQGDQTVYALSCHDQNVTPGAAITAIRSALCLLYTSPSPRD